VASAHQNSPFMSNLAQHCSCCSSLCVSNDVCTHATTVPDSHIDTDLVFRFFKVEDTRLLPASCYEYVLRGVGLTSMQSSVRLELGEKAAALQR